MEQGYQLQIVSFMNKNCFLTAYQNKFYNFMIGLNCLKVSKTLILTQMKMKGALSCKPFVHGYQAFDLLQAEKLLPLTFPFLEDP